MGLRTQKEKRKSEDQLRNVIDERVLQMTVLVLKCGWW